MYVQIFIFLGIRHVAMFLHIVFKIITSDNSEVFFIWQLDLFCAVSEVKVK